MNNGFKKELELCKSAELLKLHSLAMSQSYNAISRKNSKKFQDNGNSTKVIILNIITTAKVLPSINDYAPDVHHSIYPEIAQLTKKTITIATW